jgi:Domain of unknown function (DUF2019)
MPLRRSSNCTVWMGKPALTVLASTHREERVRLEAVAAVYRVMFGSKTIIANLVCRLARAGDAPFLEPNEAGVPRAPSMDRDKLRNLTAEQLVDRFMALAIDYDEEESPPENDRLYWQLDNVKDELKAREGEAWRLLLPLYRHPDIRIRHQAAEATRDKLPELAHDRLLAIDDVEWLPPGDYAGLFANVGGRSRRPSRLKAMTIDQLCNSSSMLSSTRRKRLPCFGSQRRVVCSGLRKALRKS